MPDPWIVPGTLTPNGTLTVDGTSSVQAGTLALGGRTLVNGDGELTADSIDFLGTEVDDEIRSELFISGGTVTTDQIAPRTDTTMFLRVHGGGTFTANAAGGIGDDSITFIDLQTGGSFLATGDQTFGGNLSRVTIGRGAGSGETELPDPSLGSNTTFRVDGNADFGGHTSDTQLLVIEGSSFEITGDAGGLGHTSIYTGFFEDSSYTVGGSATWVEGDTTSVTGVFVGSTVDIGDDWTFTNGASGVSTLSVIDTDFTIGGSFLGPINASSATDYQYTEESTVTTGGDFVVGGQEATNSAMSFVVTDSIFDIGANLNLDISDGSVMAVDITRSTLQTGGDLVQRISGDSAGGVDTLNLDLCTISTGGSLVIERINMDNHSSDNTINNLSLDLTEDFRTSHSGANTNGDNRGDVTLLFQNSSGMIGRDWLIEGGGDMAKETRVLNEIDLDIGNDVIFRMAGGIGNENEFFAADLDLDVGGDFVFELAGAADSSITQTMRLFDLRAAGDAMFRGGDEFAANESRKLSELDFAVGGDLVFAGAQKFLGDDSDPGGFLDSVFRVDGNTRFGAEGGATSLEILASNTQIIGGGLQTPDGTLTGTGFELTGLTFDLDDRVTFGGPATQDSALSAVFDGVTLDTELDIDAQMGANSVANFEFLDCPIVAGTSISVVNGNSSTLTYSQTRGSITSGGSVTFDSSNAEFASTLISIEDTPFDIADDFRVAACAAGSDSLILIQDISGQIGGDYLFEVGGRSGEITNVVLVGHQLSIGGDARFTRPGGAGGSQTFFAGNLDLGIGGDLEFGPDHVATVFNSRLRFDGAGTISGEVIASNLETAGILTVASGGILTPELTPAGVDSPALGLDASGDLIFANGSNLKIALISEGTTTPYVTARSGVNLGNANLVAMLGDDFNPPPGTVFTLIAKDGAAPVTGTFSGLAEGGSISLQTASCFGTFEISYAGGDGNDVTLTVLETSEAGATITVVDEPTYNPQTDYFEQRVTVTNPCSTDFDSFRLMVDVPAEVTVANRSGILAGVAFVQGGALASGASITFVIEFFRIDRDPDISPSYSVQITTGPPELPAAASGPAGAATRMIARPNGDVLVEFNTVPGTLYEFQYGNSPAEFLAVRPQFRAVANRTQFLDNGPPKTATHPSTVGARFYRIVEVQATGG